MTTIRDMPLDCPEATYVEPVYKEAGMRNITNPAGKQWRSSPRGIEKWFFRPPPPAESFPRGSPLKY